MPRVILLVTLMVWSLTACSVPGLKNLSQNIDPTFTPHKINFNQISWFARRAQAAYSSPQRIIQAFPNTTRIQTPKGTKVRYFLEVDPKQKIQTISIRGTNSFSNVVQDLTSSKKKEHHLGLHLHRGFDKIAMKIYQDIKPHLNRRYSIRTTGHSLGAAVGAILMMYLQKDGYTLSPSINFGQPKVTNTAGANRFQSLPITRVVDGNDPVPMFPPRTLANSSHGAYAHFGPEVILLNKDRYVYLKKHDVGRISVGEFWRNLKAVKWKDHSMEQYSRKIIHLDKTAKQVTYKQRQAFLN